MMWDVSWLVMLVALALTVASMMDYLYKARALLGFGDIAQHAKARDTDISALAGTVVEQARKRGVTVATAESLTGGMIGEAITSVAGSSEVFRGGITSYAIGVKRDVLGVDAELLASEGAVCADVALEMAAAARRLCGSDVAVAVTGIAGPGGAEPGKPVGTVWLGVSDARGDEATLLQLEGTREEVRRQTTASALEAIIARLAC